MEEFELEPGETITRSVRRHWIILIAHIFPYAFIAIVPFFFPLLLSYLYVLSPSISAHVSGYLTQIGPWLRLLFSIYLLLLWTRIFSIITRYCLTKWIITSTRIVDIHQYGFFSRQVSSFLLNRVQDITTDVEGVSETLFGFGTLNVETAGRDEKFQMRGIQNPVALRDLIMREIAALHADGSLPRQGV